MTRIVVPSSFSSDIPRRRAAVPVSMETDSIIVERPVRQVVHAVEEVVTKPRRAIVEPNPMASDDIIVEEQIPSVPRAPFHRSGAKPVILGDVARDALEKATVELQQRNLDRRTALEAIVTRDVCYACFDDKEVVCRYTQRSRRHIRVEYKRKTKPAGSDVVWEEQTNKPIIHYPEDELFGPVAFLELTDDRYRTDETINGQVVRIMEKGMLVQMRREKSKLDDGRVRDRWVYRPCDRDENILAFPLVGKISDALYSIEDADCPNRLEDICGNPIVMFDIKQFIYAFVVTKTNGETFGVVMVRDRKKNTRWIEFHPKWVSDKELLDAIIFDLAG